MKVLMLVAMFFLIAAFFLISNNHLQMKTQGSIDTFFSLYTGWLDKILENSRTVAGYVVKLEWLPDNG